MAVLTVDWRKSPRIITVAAPDTELTIQELVDSCRDLESELSAMDDDPLIAAAGKEDLGGGVSVGITVTLLNAVLQFEGRTTPLTSGLVATTDSNGIYLESTSDTFITDGVAVGDTAFNADTGAMATVVRVIDETNLEVQPLSGGGSTEWTANDAYVIYENVQCSIAGGNLVAVDDNSNTISPLLQSPNTNVIRTSSSSATLQDLESIQAASFGGLVHISIMHGVPGTTFPIGTHECPVDNLDDAKLIAVERGLQGFMTHGPLTIGATDDITNYKLVGAGATKTTVTLIDGCTMVGTEFIDMYLTGTSDGSAIIVRESVVDNLINANGFFFECALDGILAPPLGGVLNLFNCFDAIPGSGHPHIDLASVTGTVGIRGYNGDLGLINSDSNPTVSIDMSSGSIHLHNTIASGTYLIRGVTLLNDESVGGTVDKTGIVNPQNNADVLLDTDITLHTTTDSVGDWIQNKLLTVSKYLGMS